MELNQRPPACEADALPLSYAPIPVRLLGQNRMLPYRRAACPGCSPRRVRARVASASLTACAPLATRMRNAVLRPSCARHASRHARAFSRASSRRVRISLSSQISMIRLSKKKLVCGWDEIEKASGRSRRPSVSSSDDDLRRAVLRRSKTHRPAADERRGEAVSANSIHRASFGGRVRNTCNSITRARGPSIAAERRAGRFSDSVSEDSAFAIGRRRGRLAQWESASLTRKRSHVQSMYRPPYTIYFFIVFFSPFIILFIISTSTCVTKNPHKYKKCHYTAA